MRANGQSWVIVTLLAPLESPLDFSMIISVFIPRKSIKPILHLSKIWLKTSKQNLIKLLKILKFGRAMKLCPIALHFLFSILSLVTMVTSIKY